MPMAASRAVVWSTPMECQPFCIQVGAFRPSTVSRRHAVWWRSCRLKRSLAWAADAADVVHNVVLSAA